MVRDTNVRTMIEIHQVGKQNSQGWAFYQCFNQYLSPPSEVEQNKQEKKLHPFWTKKTRFQGKKALFLCLTNNLLTFITQSFL